MSTEICFHYSDFEGQRNLLNLLTTLVMSHQELVIICVGTDRVLGDALGPLVGTFLLEECRYANVYGTLKEPVHALNLVEAVESVHKHHPNALMIAVDACLGQLTNLERIAFSKDPLKPGTGVSKDLPEVGHVNIQGIVNLAGSMSNLVIQNTRLHTVYNMARVIAGTLAQTVIAHRNFAPVVKLKRA